MTPVIDVYVTSILSSAQLRTKHDRVQRILVSARVPFSTHDVASSEEAKLEWKRRNRNNNELPCIIVDGQPVGTIEQLDEAVEFGELRQFLRLDEHTSSTTTEITPPPPPPSSEKPSSLKATVDDFASLSLTETELAQLSQELSSNQTLSLPEAEPPSLTSRSSHGFATQVHDVMPLKLHRSDKDAEGNRIEYRRVGDHQRPLRIDASQDLLVLDGVEEDELEKLARELEIEEKEKEEQRAQRVGGIKVEAPSPPPKDEVPLSLQVDKETPPTPKEEIHNPTENSETSTLISTNFVPVDSIGGDGGAGLSKPLEQVQELDLSSDQVDELLLTQDTEKKEIEVLQATELEKSAIEATKLEKQHGSVQEGEDVNGTVGEEEKSEPKSSKDEVEKLKKDLKQGDNSGLNKVIELELGVPKEVAAQGETVRSDEVEISM